VSEASGLENRTFDNIEKILPGDSRLLIVFNPVRSSGEAFNSIRSPRYKSFRMNCLEAPNVQAKKIIYPGQVDWNWINDLVHKPGMVSRLNKDEARQDMHDFEWEGQWYRPSNLFLVMVIGEPPREGENVLIPRMWVEMANERWHKRNGKYDENEALRLGVDVAGMGADKTAIVFRYGNMVPKIKNYNKMDHMALVGKIKNILDINEDSNALIDTIGEGAGTYSRLKELGMMATSAKFSAGVKGKKDYTGQRTFANARAYCLWAVRDMLDPEFDDYREPLALPDDEDLMNELCEHTWSTKSNGDIIIESKDDIKARLGHSPDNSDALALTYFPVKSRGRAGTIG